MTRRVAHSVRSAAPRLLTTVLAAGLAAAVPSAQDGTLFRSGIDLVDVTVTVTDGDERFVSGLRREDFAVFEDGVAQEIALFSNEPVPVSLGIALDTSGSMTSDKLSSARAAIERLVTALADDRNEFFYMQFANRPDLVRSWTGDRRAIARAVGSAFAAGGTAMYDAVAEAIPVAQSGVNPKKALVVISDGNDTISEITVPVLRSRIRESDVLVYAMGIDGAGETRRPPVIRLPPPTPFPVPGRRRPQTIPWPSGPVFSRSAERVNADALRQITDSTGGRTEVLRGFGDLDGATARLADELSKQYYLAYASTGARDGRWHTIRVEVRGRRVTVRARAGFIAAA